MSYTMFFNVLSELPDPGAAELIDYYKQELTYKRQFLIYILELKSDVQISEQNIDGLQAKYENEITELKSLIGNKSSIPKDQVYPRFDSLSQIYSQLLEEKNLAVLRSDLFGVLREYKQNMTNQLSEVLIRESRALYAEKASLEKRLEEERAAAAAPPACSICMDNVRGLVCFWPCGHASVCAGCDNAVNQCPVCRSDIRQRAQLFMCVD